MESNDLKENAETLKDQGNAAIKEKKFHEAILHYTHAIKLDINNYTLHSNRSYAFLMIKQYYYALEDAKETIRINPAWAKGYFRKAEVEYAVGNYLDACDSYQEALKRKPDDTKILQDLKTATRAVLKERTDDQQIPWLGSGIGLILGVIIVISDYIFTQKPTHPMLMVFVTMIIALVGYGIAKTYRYYVKAQRKGLIEPPIDLVKEEETTSQEDKKFAPRFTKSQARQRYKKGKI